MQFIHEIFSFNPILTVSLLGWFVAQVLKTLINFILLGKFQLASVVAIITMHDAMGVRHETGEQAKVLNQMIAQWIDVSEKNAPFLQNMHLKEMVGHTPLQVVAGVLVGVAVGLLYPIA